MHHLITSSRSLCRNWSVVAAILGGLAFLVLGAACQVDEELKADTEAGELPSSEADSAPALASVEAPEGSEVPAPLTLTEEQVAALWMDGVPDPLTQEQIGALSMDEVREALVRVAKARKRNKGGDPALDERLLQEQRWLMGRLREIRW